MPPPHVALVIGHRRSRQGAVSVDGTSEWDWNSRHSLRLQDALLALGVSSVIVEREDRSDGYSRLPARVNATHARCCVALHWNSSASAKATGSEVLYYVGSKRGQGLAQALDLADDVLGLRDRGLGGVLARGWEVVKDDDARHGALVLPGPMSRGTALDKAANLGAGYRAQRQRGAYLLQETAMPCVIVEPAFGSNVLDWAALNGGAAELARAQADALAGWLR